MAETYKIIKAYSAFDLDGKPKSDPSATMTLESCQK